MSDALALVPDEVRDPPRKPFYWDYDASVKQVQQAIYKWKNLTIEIADELYTARQMLSTGGRTKSGEHSWSEYCDALGVHRSTVHLWLKRIFESVENSTLLAPVACRNIPPRFIHDDFRYADIQPESVDAIITDPPYGKEYLPLYGDLVPFAKRTLKPGGSMLVMTGQSYLPEVFERLQDSDIRYQWLVAYLTPGGQSAQLWQRNVNTFWKPVLWFVYGDYSGQWIGDVAKSAVNDNDKRFHEWGQSESGMADLIERFTTEGQTVCDPFMGAGTTGVAAVQLDRNFIGIDVDAEAVAQARSRFAE